ncbi:MAG: sugar ABC transporter permease [Phycisphaerales bacterium]|nr:sugar ABC transporter permease [Phycisphaerales bacterium]
MAVSRTSLGVGLLWIAPWWLGFMMFLAIPLGISFYISLSEYPLLQPPLFVGAANYSTLAVDPVFHKVLYNTLLFSAAFIPLSTAAAIALAILVNQRLPGQPFFRACIFAPTIVPLVATAVVWMRLFNPETGPINETMAAAGIDGPLWLASPRWAIPSLVFVSLWGVGSPMVIYLAGLQEIPETLYEAARLDGANSVGRFRHVTLPGLSPVILFNVVMAIINALQIFALPYILWDTDPGPERAGYFYTSYLFDNAFRFLKFGYASAMGWIQLLLILGLTAFVFAVSRRTVYYRGA